jgi:FixJ family two-component response regulator
MPGKTGFDLQEALRAECRDLPIVFISGHGDAAMAARSVALGAIALLRKPVDEAALLGAIRLGLERDREALRQEAGSKSTEA